MNGLNYLYVILTWLICGLSRQGFAKQMECTGAWQAIHRACYKFDLTPKKWQDALDICAEEGGTLLSIGSTVEFRKISKSIQKRINTDKLLTWWVGLKRSKDSNKFDYWLDGIRFSTRVTRWSNGEPNNKRNRENCVEIKFDGHLNDKSCDIERPFVCELNEITQRPTFHTTAQATTEASTTKATAILTSSTTTVVAETTKRIIYKPPTTVNRPTKVTNVTTAVPTKPISPPTNPTVFVNEDFSKYRKCYNFKAIVKSRKVHKSANMIQFDATSSCPSMEASGIVWPETEAGQVSITACKQGSGSATFRCGKNPVCWRTQPDVSGCASQKFKNVLQKANKIFKGEGVTDTEDSTEDGKPEVVEVTVNETLQFTNSLAEITASDDVSEADVMLTTQLLKRLTNTKFVKSPRSKKEIKNIVKNVVKAGSNLVSKNKSSTWSEMKEVDKVRTATTLLVAMESATVNMAESLDEPVVIQSKDENIDLELHVLNVSSIDAGPLVYGKNSDENSFSIPKETLQKFSKGGLAKAVFMTHYQMADILQDKVAEDEDENDSFPRIASYIISASLGGHGHIKLPQPITFTMKHIQKFPPNSDPLCSFLNLTEGSFGIWSQDGCKVIKSDASHTTCQCDHLTNFAILMDVQGVELSIVHSSLLRFITIVGCIISALCLFVCWITFNCFSSIQGERTSIHKNLVFCLFVAEVLFLVGIDKTQDQLACSLIAGFLHYFFLTAFTWMFIEGIHIICMLVQVFDAAKSRLPYYYFVGYGFPLAIVAVSAGIFHEGYGTDKYCWLTTERYFIWSFAGPIAIVLLVNCFILIYAMSTVCRHSEYVFNAKEKNGTDMRAWIQGAIAIEVILGLTWIFGYFFISQETIALAYIFTILNSLQGLFIFCFHCLLNKKVIKEYKRIFHITKRPASSTQTASLMKKQGASYELSQHNHSNTDSRA